MRFEGIIMNLSSMLDNIDGKGQPLELDITLIDEDPNQPRVDFDEDGLKDLANSIKERGVKSAISVRSNPNEAGRYIINHGARRYRASVLVGKTTIPANIDDDYSFSDQIVENVQRADLTPQELAKAVEKLEKDGFKKGDIATRLGKSNAWVTQYSRLNKLPSVIADAFESGKISDVTVANELAKIYESNPDDVQEVLNNEQEIGRSDVKNLKSFINSEVTEESNNEAQVDDKKYTIADQDQPPKLADEKAIDPTKLKNPKLKGTYQGQLVTLNTKKRPSDTNLIWVKFDESGFDEEAEIDKIKLTMLMEAE